MSQVASENISKSGWKTSEFWVTVAVLVASIADGFGVNVEIGAAEAIAGGLYALGRSIFKSARP